MKIGFIGAGHMGSALIRGLLKAQVVLPQNIFVKGGSNATAEKLQKELDFQLVSDYEAFAGCDVIFLAVGAKVVRPIVKELAPHYTPETVLISVAIGHTNQDLLDILGNQASVVHAIPNTPVSVNAGMTGVSYGQTIGTSQKLLAEKVLTALGHVEEVDESLLGTFGTVAGCSPAFVDVFMEALSDAAVMEGLPRALSYEIAAQMMYGTAKLALETKKHPGELKDGVTSPGGSTIKGIAALEKNAFRYAIIDAIKKANN